MIGKAMTKEFNEGAADFRNGLPMINPYRHDDDNREHDWEAGWYHAEECYSPREFDWIARQSITCNFG